MLKCCEDRIVLGGLAAFAIWAFIMLPLLSADDNLIIAFWRWSTHDPVAAFTAVLAISTIGLWIVTWRSGVRQSADMQASIAAAQKSAELAEHALTKLERPYIFVSNVGRLETDIIEDQEENYGEALLSIKYSVANYGKIPAIIVDARASLHVSVAPRNPDHLPHSHSLVVSPIFAPGDARHEIPEWLVWSDHGHDEDGSYIPILGEDRSLFFWIVITYRGPFTDGHETRACWRYNESTGRFVAAHGGPDYNSEK
jgi:hypothetical protein